MKAGGCWKCASDLNATLEIALSSKYEYENCIYKPRNFEFTTKQNESLYNNRRMRVRGALRKDSPAKRACWIPSGHRRYSSRIPFSYHKQIGILTRNGNKQSAWWWWWINGDWGYDYQRWNDYSLFVWDASSMPEHPEFVFQKRWTLSRHQNSQQPLFKHIMNHGKCILSGEWNSFYYSYFFFNDKRLIISRFKYYFFNS